MIRPILYIEFNGEPIGTVRLYDARQNSFCWGSWILKAGSPKHAAIESALMVYAYAVDHLSSQSAHFDVRKDNEGVWLFMKDLACGASQKRIWIISIRWIPNQSKLHASAIANICLMA